MTIEFLAGWIVGAIIGLAIVALVAYCWPKEPRGLSRGMGYYKDGA